MAKKIQEPEVKKVKEVKKKERVKKFEIRAHKEGSWGIAYIFSTTNNTIVHITDVTGSETIAKCSGGIITNKDRDQGGAFPAMQAATRAAQEAIEKGIIGVHIRVRGKGGHHKKAPGAGAQPSIRALARSGLRIGLIEDVTPIPSDVTKRPGGRRGRRV